MWDKARLAAYLAGLLGIIATIAAALGYGTYDSATGMYDPPAFSIYALSGLLISLISSGLAALAWLKGWARK